MDETNSDNRLHILLVEDNPGDAGLFREYLSEVVGYSFLIDWAETFERGTEVVERTDPDVVFLDLGLPDASPEETIEGLGDWSNSVPVVVLTGQARDAQELEALRHGAGEFLEKGALEPHLLKRCIDRALERERIRIELDAKQKALQKYRTIIENTRDLVSIKNRQGRYQLVNPSFLQTVGMDEEEVIGKTDREVFGETVGCKIEERDR